MYCIKVLILKLFNNFDFWWDERLIPIIDEYYSDFWLPGDIFSKEYSRSLLKKINSEIEIRDLSVRNIDDKKVQKLLDIFVKPKLTTEVLEYDNDEKKKIIKHKNISINSFNQIEENILLSGEQGAGKTRILNTIGIKLAETRILNDHRKLPVKLKAPEIIDNDYEINKIIEKEVKFLTGEFYDAKIFRSFDLVLLIDDSDLLKSKDKEDLFKFIKDYCDKNNHRYIITYRRADYDIDKSIKKITIHNFNTEQVESFIEKYFEGSDRGQKFIKILKESDILSRLPTTPLTITLISLLYDENNYEIPATLSDIYTDFTSVLLGNLMLLTRPIY